MVIIYPFAYTNFRTIEISNYEPIYEHIKAGLMTSLKVNVL